MPTIIQRKAKTLLESTEKRIAELRTDQNIIESSKEAIKIYNDALLALKDLVKSVGFLNEEDEILFFKQIKPSFLSKVIHYHTIHKIEIARPRGPTEVKIKYLDTHLEKINLYFEKNHEFITYLKSGGSTLDRDFFTNKKPSPIYNPFSVCLDDIFSSKRDQKVAVILACEMTAVYLEREIQKLQQPRSTHENPKQLIFKWTDKKIDLVELIYALYASRSLNNGKVDIADIATFFEKSFQVEIGDVYRKYIEIKNRKFETTKYLDHLSEILRKKIEDEL